MTPNSRLSPVPDDSAPLPPHNDDAEQAVLGSILLDREVVGRIATILEPRDFYTLRNEMIYQAIVDLDARGEPVDYLTITTELNDDDRPGGASSAVYLAGLLGVVPTPIHAERYAKIVADAAFMRRLISAGGKIATLGFQNQVDTETAIAKAEQLLVEVAGSGRVENVVSMADALRDYVNRFTALADLDPSAAARIGRIPTTHLDLDRLLSGGLVLGDLILLAARPAMGKTSLMLQIVAQATTTWKIKVAVFSLEMKTPQLIQRMLATLSGVPISTLENPSRLSRVQQDKLGDAIGTLAETNIIFDDSSAQTVSSIRSKVRRLMTRGGVDLVVVDHIQLVAGRGENRVAEMSAVSRGLKALAGEQNVALLALSQLSRAVEQRSDKKPILSDLRDTGSLEQDADVVLGLYRDDYYNRDSERSRIADVLVLKHRNGQTGETGLIWNPLTTGFRDP